MRLANEYGINSYVATLPPLHLDDHYDHGMNRAPPSACGDVKKAVGRLRAFVEVCVLDDGRFLEKG
jgi:hypothetical protein